jgi:glycosyltransferase involved in cell wall biosynthesis
MLEVVTLATKKSLRNANALGNSLLNTNPTSNFRICVIDDLDNTASGLSEFDIVPVLDIGVEEYDLKRLALMLEEDELCNALKPWLLQKVLQEGNSHVLYLAPQILVLGDLTQDIDLNSDYQVTLTPNLLAPIPNDSLRPTELEILNQGLFQPGFILVSSKSSEFLSWWKQRVEIDPMKTPSTAHLKIQRWLDLVPGLWRTKILEIPTYNVGFWNVAQRKLSMVDEQVLVCGKPIVFFNFDGFDPKTPWVLNSNSGEEARTWPRQNDALVRLCEYYSQALDHQTGYPISQSYGFEDLDGYGRITSNLRHSFRTLVIETKPSEHVTTPVPFAGEDQLVVDFIRNTIPGSEFVNMPILSAWRSRPDVQAAFPDPLGVDGKSLLIWSCTSGIQEGYLKEEDISHLRGKMDHSESVPPAHRTDRFGVNVVGYFTSELGVGELARKILDSLKKSGIPYKTVLSNRNNSRKSLEFLPENSTEIFPMNIAVLNADQMTNWHTLNEFSEIHNLPTIGVWAWELEEFPSGFEKVSEFINEIWTISEFSKNAIQKSTEKPVYVLPLTQKSTSKADLQLPHLNHIEMNEKKYFLAMFDYQSSIERKNPIAVIKAFRAAFQGNRDVHLIIKTINAHLWPTQREMLLYSCLKDENVFVVDSYLTELEVKALMKNAIAYVSLHRSEGYGLTCAEAMALGTPVIATGYSGNLDFMTSENSLLVDYDLVSVNDSTGTYTVDSKWAEPQIDSAANHMAMVFNDAEMAQRIGKLGQDTIRAIAASGMDVKFVKERLTYIHSSTLRELFEKEPLDENTHP